MKKPYQIESQRAVKRLEGMAAEGDPVVQMVLPMAEMLGWLREGVGEEMLPQTRGGICARYHDCQNESHRFFKSPSTVFQRGWLSEQRV